MQTKKVGSTIRVILRFTAEEWEYISTADELLAEIETPRGREYQFTIIQNDEGRELLLQAQTSQPEPWMVGDYRADLKVVKDGFVSYYPDTSFIQFKLINPISETANFVDA